MLPFGLILGIVALVSLLFGSSIIQWSASQFQWMNMHASRMQVLLTVLAGIFLLATVSIFAVFALAPGTAVVYRPFLLTSFVITLFISLVAIAWLLRGLLRPYSQLIGEARRAPVAPSGKTPNQAALVLETFPFVIGQF